MGDATGCVLVTVRNGQPLNHHTAPHIAAWRTALHGTIPLLTTVMLSLLSPSPGMTAEQIAVCQPGKSVTIRNAKVEMYKGHMRLVVDIWGLIEQSENELDEQPLTTNNLSSIEYELVDA